MPPVMHGGYRPVEAGPDGKRGLEMTSVKWAKRQLERSRKSRGGISTIMANLTMLIIVVSLTSLLFIWATTSFGLYAGGAGFWYSSRSIANQEKPSVESVFFGNAPNCSGGYSYCVTVYVRNVGTTPITISSIYVNSTLYTQSYPPVLVNQVQQYQF